MNVAQAVNPGAVTFNGPVAHEMVAHSGSNLGAVAHKIAAHFMANMDSDVFHDDHAHGANLAVKAGIGKFAVSGLAFANVDSGFKAPAAGPDASGKDTTVSI